MEWLGAIGGGCFILASLVIGARVLMLARRTRELPEIAMGLGLVLMGGLSYPINVAARVSVDLSPDLRVGMMLLSQLLMWLGCIAIGVFNWRVFRPQARWPFFLLVVFASAMFVIFLDQCMTVGMFAFVDAREGIYRFSIVPQGIPYVWGFIESFLYHRKLRKRIEFGLADPLVTRRIGLWALTMGASTAINWFMITLEVLNIDSATAPIAGLFVGPVGMVCAVSLWLAFRPAENSSGSAVRSQGVA
jgi:hypothetical protein